MNENYTVDISKTIRFYKRLHHVIETLRVLLREHASTSPTARKGSTPGDTQHLQGTAAPQEDDATEALHGEDEDEDYRVSLH